MAGLLKIKVLQTAVNGVTLQVDLKRGSGARIYRSLRATGPYEEVGLAPKRIYVDTATLTPGKTYYYLATPCPSPWLIPEPEDLRSGKPVEATGPAGGRAALGIVFLLSAICQANWPQYLGPDRNAISPESQLAHSWPEKGPYELWTIDVGVG